jgi:hypothetical protein
VNFIYCKIRACRWSTRLKWVAQKHSIILINELLLCVAEDYKLYYIYISVRIPTTGCSNVILDSDIAGSISGTPFRNLL